METPPTFNPPPGVAPRKSKTGCWIAGILGGLAICCGLPLLLGGLGVWTIFKKGGNLISCAMSFAEAREAIKRYANAHGGKLPNAKSWQDDIRTYYIEVDHDPKYKGPFKSIKTFDADGIWLCTDDKKLQTGIAFNSDLSGKKLDSIDDPYRTALIFEVDHLGKNQAESYKGSPKSQGPDLMGTHREWIVLNVKGSSKSNTFDFEDENDVKPKNKSSDTSDDQ